MILFHFSGQFITFFQGNFNHVFSKKKKRKKKKNLPDITQRRLVHPDVTTSFATERVVPFLINEALLN